MATPDQFIDITDFSPGIHSDFHAARPAFGGTAAEITGAAMANGAATVDGTRGCHADRTGALVPMPLLSVGRRDTTMIPTGARTAAAMDPARRDTYLLDAQVGPITTTRQYFLDSDPTDEQGDPMGDEAEYLTRPSIFTTWGFYWSSSLDGVEEDSDWAYVLGREYRQWSEIQPIMDFLLTHTVRRGTRGNSRNPLPVGGLCLSRWNWSGSQLNSDLQRELWLGTQSPAVVVMAGSAWPGHPVGNGLATGLLNAVELGNLTEVWSGTPRELTHPFDNYSPPITPIDDPAYTDAFRPRVPHQPGAIVGMSLLPDINGDFGTTVDNPDGLVDYISALIGPDNITGRSDQWVFHSLDDAEMAYPYNLLYAATMVLAHQGRIVLPGLHRAWSGGRIQRGEDPADDVKLFAQNDVLWYSEWGLPLNDWLNANPDDPEDETWVERFTRYIPLLAAEDQVAEIGTVGVTTSDELLIVKARDGGVLVSGDLDNPTIRRLPYVESTHGLVCRGAQTPIGFVYGSRNGIFVWQGGDTTKRLSAQLDGFFWDHTQGAAMEQYAGSRGRMTFWDRYVCVPNDYAFDVDTESWWRWRTEEGPALNCYEEDHAGRLYAFAYKTGPTAAPGGGSSDVIWHEATPGTLERTYEWKSHPLVETRGRIVSVQDVRIVATAGAQPTVPAAVDSTITVNLIGYSETGEQISTGAVELSLANQVNPQILRADISPNFTAEYIQVSITATDGEGRAAPKIHALRIGYKDRRSTVRHGEA